MKKRTEKALQDTSQDTFFLKKLPGLYGTEAWGDLIKGVVAMFPSEDQPVVRKLLKAVKSEDQLTRIINGTNP